jgi:hypothetical protein
MATSSLLKSPLHNSIAQALYDEIQNRNARYYYFLGRTLTWDDEEQPPYPIDSFDYELKVRNEIITLKEIKSTDVAFVTKRVDWVSGQIWDMYDDQYSDEVQGINLISGGYGYSDPPTITIIGGGGTGAVAVPTIVDGVIISITMVNRGRGYTSQPTVLIQGGGGEGAAAEAVVNIAYSGAQRLEDVNCVVMTDEYNVYKCLDNNNNAISTYKPIGTVVDPVIMPDGYMWKYLYSIPIALRNKFLTDVYMPVVNALRGQFYSDGEILNVVIENNGQNYSFANITVSGDGYRASDPLILQNVQINTGGTGYTSGATCTIDPPFAGANAWTNGVAILLGQRVEYNNNLYEATMSGVMATPAPTHKSGIVSNGTSALKYIGTRATGTVTTSGGQVTGIVLKGSILEITITNSGSGYTSIPAVSLSGGGGSSFVGTCVMSGTGVSKVVISDSGINYTSAPSVVFGTPWATSTAYTVGQQIFYANRLYTVTGAGTSSSSASAYPTHVSGSATNGTATLTYAGVPATGTAALKYGSGYSTLPAISIQPISGGSGAKAYFVGVKSEAKLLPIIDSGQIVGVQIDDGGIGYTYANISVTGDGDSASLRADLSPGDVNTLQANTELLTSDGRIMAYPVVSGGFGYGNNPPITITGDGTGAAAHAIVEGGAIKKIVVDNYGLGYRWAKVTVGGSGYGAVVRPVMAPYGGHGKDPITGMFTNTLMFYTNISKDTNQGFNVNNDFRQLGIIKNPRQFGSYGNLKSSLASACYVLTGFIDTVTFTPDMLITLGDANGARFRIVSLTSTGMLVQSLDNAVPQVGNIFLNPSANTFSASGVTAPTADKYSGKLLFIDNKQAFTPTADQTVTLRTVIKF